MRGVNPNIPVGISGEAIAARSLHELNHGAPRKLINSPTIKWTKTSKGIKGDVYGIQNGASLGSVINLTLYWVWPDYLDCYDADDNHYAIAKMPNLRNSITVEYPFETEIDYTYPHNLDGDILSGCYRIATVAGSGDPEVQYVEPQYNCYGSVASLSPYSIITAVLMGVPNVAKVAAPWAGGGGLSADSQTYIPSCFDSDGNCVYQEIGPRDWCASSDQSFGT